MTTISVVKHARGAPGLRLLGLGPCFRPNQGITKLQILLEKHAFWAKNRSKKEIRKMLANSSIVISLWQKTRLVGFGRATTDEIYRAVLWDIVVADDLQGIGLGRIVVEALLDSPGIKNVEKVYLMTTNSTEFYEQMDFQVVVEQTLLSKKSSE
tara:strand:- start:616 stop:1077 length:462 start_codon:yes stop_codon:yes gene_type:complete